MAAYKEDHTVTLTVVAVVLILFVGFFVAMAISLSGEDQSEVNRVTTEDTYVPPVPVNIPGVGFVMVG